MLNGGTILRRSLHRGLDESQPISLELLGGSSEWNGDNSHQGIILHPLHSLIGAHAFQCDRRDVLI